MPSVSTKVDSVPHSKPGPTGLSCSFLEKEVIIMPAIKAPKKATIAIVVTCDAMAIHRHNALNIMVSRVYKNVLFILGLTMYYCADIKKCRYS